MYNIYVEEKRKKAEEEKLRKTKSEERYKRRFKSNKIKIKIPKKKINKKYITYRKYWNNVFKL